VQEAEQRLKFEREEREQLRLQFEKEMGIKEDEVRATREQARRAEEGRLQCIEQA
jgi:hypothetical protein